MSDVRNRKFHGIRQNDHLKREKGIVLLLMFSLLILYSSFLTGTASAAQHGIAETLKNHIMENYPWPEIEISNIVLNADAPDAKPERILVEKGLPNRTVFLIDYGKGKKITATAQVKAFDRVVMSRRAFRKGYQLQEEDVYTTLMDITRIPKDALRNSDQVGGSALSRSVIANMPIVMAMLGEAQQVVKRGQRVTLIIDTQGMNITAKGELKENSAIGNYVKVLTLDSKRTVSGRLLNENTVKVEF